MKDKVSSERPHSLCVSYPYAKHLRCSVLYVSFQLVGLALGSGVVDDGCAVAVCSGDGVAVLELASGSGDTVLGAGVCRDVGELFRSILAG